MNSTEQTFGLRVVVCSGASSLHTIKYEPAFSHSSAVYSYVAFLFLMLGLLAQSGFVTESNDRGGGGERERERK